MALRISKIHVRRVFDTPEHPESWVRSETRGTRIPSNIGKLAERRFHAGQPAFLRFVPC